MIDLLLKLFRTGAVVDTIQSLFQSKVDTIKMDFYKKLSNVLASILLIIIVSFVVLMMTLFLGFGLSFYFNIILESSYLGFVIVGGLFLLAAWFMSFTIRTGYLKKKMYKVMLNILNSDQEETEN
jgi:hypothetical protein